MEPAVIWLVAALVLIGAEVVSGEFVLLMLGCAALVAAGVSLLVVSPLVGALAFGGSAVLLVFGVRPVLRRKLNRGLDTSVMHTDALVGGEAVVVARVDGTGGRVKIAGDVWSARAFDESQVLEPGTQVRVMQITGATAMVLSDE